MANSSPSHSSYGLSNPYELEKYYDTPGADEVGFVCLFGEERRTKVAIIYLVPLMYDPLTIEPTQENFMEVVELSYRDNLYRESYEFRERSVRSSHALFIENGYKYMKLSEINKKLEEHEFKRVRVYLGAKGIDYIYRLYLLRTRVFSIAFSKVDLKDIVLPGTYMVEIGTRMPYKYKLEDLIINPETKVFFLRSEYIPTEKTFKIPLGCIESQRPSDELDF